MTRLALFLAGAAAGATALYLTAAILTTTDEATLLDTWLAQQDHDR